MNELNWTEAQHTLVKNLIAEEVEKAQLILNRTMWEMPEMRRRSI
jgi:hypothetical protein